MSKTYLILILLVSVRTYSQTKIDTLNNETIIKLTKSKLPGSVIIQKINTSFCSFDISVDGLIKLKESQVGDSVINLMIQIQGKANAASFIQAKDNSNDKNHTFTESGIYFLEDAKYTNLDPTIVSTARPKTGILNIKYKSQIEGAEANYQLKSKRPEFYFNFETVKKNLNDANANATTTSKDNYLDQLLDKIGYGYSNSNYQAISPNDFKLIKLDKNKNKREFVSGKVSAFGQYDMSIDDKNIVNFKYEKISANTYKIKFDKDLSPGEYCFLYLGNNNNAAYVQWYGQNNFKVFDFGISK